MSTLFNAMANEANQTMTTNGDLAVVSTFNSNLDFFGLAGSKRGDQEGATLLFEKAFFEDPKTALKNMLYIRDIRKGQGERATFKACLKELSTLNKQYAINMIPLVPELGRWDDLFVLLENDVDKDVQKAVIDFVRKQLLEDIDAEFPSLLAKWMPSVNTSSKATRKLAKRFCVEFGMNEKTYRQGLSTIRAKLNLIENKLSTKDYTFDYTKIPAKAMMKYTKAFYRNDEERFVAFKNVIKEDPSVVADKVDNLFLYEIVAKAKSEQEFADALWNSLDKTPFKNGSKTIVVRDGSGSMWASPYGTKVTANDVATSLTIYASERLTGAFKNSFITFSNKPKLITLNDNMTLSQKINRIEREGEVASTNIERTYDLILEASKKANPEDYLDTVIFISDMQFNAATYCIWDRNTHTPTQSTFDQIKQKFDEANIPMPRMVYWNVLGLLNQFPTTDIKNAGFVSGFSKANFDAILSGKILSALDIMQNALEPYNEMVDTIMLTK